MAKHQKKPAPKTNPAAATKSAAPPSKPAPPPIDWSAMADKYGFQALLCILAVAFLVRVLWLDAHSLWVDEFVHVNRARYFLQGKSNLLTDDNNGILLTTLLMPLFKIFGSTPFWARILSVLFGTGMVWLMYQISTRLFNRYVGLLAAWFGTISLFLIFWSRMSRNYAIFGFFFLLAGWLFLEAWEQSKPSDTEQPTTFWARNNLSRRHLIALPFVLLLSLLSHQLTFFFIFIAGFYCLGMAIRGFWTQATDRRSNKYVWVSALFIPFLLMVLVPGLSGVGRSLFSGLALSQIGDYAFPKWSRIGQLWKEKPYEAFSIYLGVLRSDLSFTFWLGIAGLILAFRYSFRVAWWLVCCIVFPLLLLCLIYREPSVQRYIIFIVPYLLIAAAVACWSIWDLLRKQIPSNTMAWVVLALPFAFSLVSLKWDQLSNLVLAQKLEGHVIDGTLSEWSFTNWREPCDYVQKNGQPSDLILSTVPNAVNYYLNREDVLWFRQMTLNTALKKYVPNTPTTDGKPSAASFEDLVRTVGQHPRGWLLGDYYLDNIFTDEKTLLWVYQNMEFHPDASKESGVMVFSWDRSKPKPANQNFVVEVGKWEDRIESRIYTINLPQEAFAQAGIEMQLRIQHVNSNREGMVVFNNNNAAWLPPTSGKNIEDKVLNIQKDWVRPGANTIQFIYDTDRKKDPVPGYQVYALALYGK